MNVDALVDVKIDVLVDIVLDADALSNPPRTSRFRKVEALALTDFPDVGAALLQLAVDDVVLDGEVARFDQKLVSTF